MRGTVMVGLLLGAAGALQVPGALHRRSSTPSMAEVYDPSAFFEEEKPITWASPEWQWGSASGEAHTVAARVREELGMPHRRSALISYAKMAAVDFFDLKMAREQTEGIKRSRAARAHTLTREADRHPRSQWHSRASVLGTWAMTSLTGDGRH